jgi:hypoxanthine-guanine phosphoribosyltransferase
MSIFAITRYSPLDIDSLLSNHARTLDPNEESDFLYIFSYSNKKYKSKVVIVFNSYEYCSKRDLMVIDNKNENIIDVIKTLKIICLKLDMILILVLDH